MEGKGIRDNLPKVQKLYMVQITPWWGGQDQTAGLREILVTESEARKLRDDLNTVLEGK